MELYRFDHNWDDDARFVVYKNSTGKKLGASFIQARPIPCKFE